MWSLNNVSGCGSTSFLFLVLVQGLTKVSDQSHALEDRNDSNNSLEVCTPNSFIQQQSRYGCSRYAQYTDYPKWFCLLGEDNGSLLSCRILPLSIWLAICAWHPCLGWSLGTGNLWTFLPFPVGCSQQISTVPTPSNGGNPGIRVSYISTVPTPSNGGNPGIEDSSNSPLSVTADRCEK